MWFVLQGRLKRCRSVRRKHTNRLIFQNRVRNTDRPKYLWQGVFQAIMRRQCDEESANKAVGFALREQFFYGAARQCGFVFLLRRCLP